MSNKDGILSKLTLYRNLSAVRWKIATPPLPTSSSALRSRAHQTCRSFHRLHINVVRLSF